MEKIEVGEYVRTKKGEIFKVAEVVPTLGKEIAIVKKGNGNPRRINLKEEKHSKNIIELIESRDIIEFKIKNFDFTNLGIVHKEYDARKGDYYKIVSGHRLEEIQIISILTKEQYVQNCYTVERKE